MVEQIENAALAALTWACVEECVKRTNPEENQERVKRTIWMLLCLSDIMPEAAPQEDEGEGR